MTEPKYYAGNGLSPLEAFKQGLISKEELVGFCKGNVIKYTVRAGNCICDSISRYFNGTFEELTYDDIVKKLNEYEEELNMLAKHDSNELIEIKHINNIYMELGFNGVIEYAKKELNKYGTVREVDKGLWMMATGGWSEHEDWLDCVNSFACMFSRHWRGMLRGGAFYYTEEAYGEIEIIKKKIGD